MDHLPSCPCSLFAKEERDEYMLAGTHGDLKVGLERARRTCLGLGVGVDGSWGGWRCVGESSP